jgi:predicted DNA-binding transcriptional regulator AlpA
MTDTPKTNEEAAAIIRVKPTTLIAWRHQGRGPKYLKIGRSCFYRESDIREWLDAQAVIPMPKEALPKTWPRGG